MDELTDQPPPTFGTPDLWELLKPRVDEDGVPIYDEIFFLALARRGADVWNEWRATHTGGIRVTFANVDFVWVIDFSGFNFGDGANFSGASFRGRAVNFCGATFGREANFSGADFTGNAKFSGATFGQEVSFAEAAFGADANFCGAIFHRYAEFSAATFGPGAKLTGWSSEEQTKFRISLVEGPLSDIWNEDRKAAFVMRTEAEAVRSEKFLSIVFMAARFLGGVDFSGRQFDEVADFTLARFDELPRFQTLVNVNFYGVKIGFASPVTSWTTGSTAATRLRYLRKLADDAKNHDLERDLYILERRAEHEIHVVTLLVSMSLSLVSVAKRLNSGRSDSS